MKWGELHAQIYILILTDTDKWKISANNLYGSDCALI